MERERDVLWRGRSSGVRHNLLDRETKTKATRGKETWGVYLRMSTMEDFNR